MAFKHRISFATDLAANLGCNRFRITPDIISKLLCAAIWSRCAVRLESEQTPFPGTGRISFATDFAANLGCDRFKIMPDIVSKLLRSAIWSRCAVARDSVRNLLFCSYVIFLLRDQWIITRFSEAMGVALVGNNFWSILWDLHFPMNKKSVVTTKH